MSDPNEKTSSFRVRKSSLNKALFVPLLEALEDRTAPALITVMNGNDGGEGSLRHALADANIDDTITFANTLSGQTITLTSGELAVSKALRIDGDLDDDGVADVTIARSSSVPNFRIFNVDDSDNSNAVDVLLEGLVITGGMVNQSGGGIFNRESLRLTNSTITGNSASDGGGVLSSGTLNITNSTITGNSALYDGGGVLSFGSVNVVNSSITGNSAGRNEPGIRPGNGGGINLRDGNLTITNSTLTGNFAVGRGGGSYIRSSNASVTNSTISDNSALRGAGGGVFHGYGSLSLSNSTISGNSGFSGGGVANLANLSFGPSSLSVANSTITGNSAVAGLGGGILNSGTTTLASSLISGNVASGAGTELSNDPGGTVNASDSLFGDSSQTNAQAFSNFAPSLVNNITATSDGSNSTALTDILDTTLRNNGGPTLTHALVAGSPAINAGSNPDSLEFDQRGEGFRREFAGQSDIGAFEAQPRTFVVDINNDESDGDLSPGNLSLREAIEAANLNLGADTITFASSLASETIQLNNSPLEITDDLNIQGLGAESLTIANNGQVFVINQSTVSATISSLTIAGGISNSLGTLSLMKSTITGNSGTFSGSGINNSQGSLSLMNSTITGNSTTYEGGGISNLGGNVTVTNSTISGNSASQGGAIFSFMGNVSVINSTISGNSASQGGAIFNRAGVTTVTSSLISGNRASIGAAEVVNLGRGAIVNASDSLFGESSQTNAQAFSNFAPSLMNNITATSDGSNSTALTDILDTTLRNNGGPTQTHALVAGSPAINAGSNPEGLTTDQRGLFFVREFDGRADIGAFEFGIVPPTAITLTIEPDSFSENGGTATGTITLDQPAPADITITLDSDDTSEASVPVSVTIPAGSDSTTFTIAGADDDLDDDNQTVTITASAAGLTEGTATVEVIDDESTPIVVGPIADFEVLEDAAPITILLPDVFSDLDQNDADLFFEVTNNSNLTLVSAVVDNDADTLTLTFLADQNGAAEITVKATDEDNLSVTDTFVVTVLPVEENAEAVDDSATIGYRDVVDLAVLDNDLNPAGIDLAVVSFDDSQTKGNVTLNDDGTFEYDPNGWFAYLDRGETATDAFSYTIDDGNGGTDSATVTITIEGPTVVTNSGTAFSFSQGTNGGSNTFGFDGDAFFLSGQGVGGKPKFQDFDAFFAEAARVFGGTNESSGEIDDQVLPSGQGPDCIIVTADNEVLIQGSGIEGAYEVQFDDPSEATVFKAFVERFFGEIDTNDAVATDPTDFRFDAGEVRVFFDDVNMEFGFTMDNGLTQFRFDNLEEFVEGLMAELGGEQVKDGSFNAQNIANGAVPNQIRVKNQTELIVSGKSVGGQFKFEFEEGAAAELAEWTLEILFDKIAEANALANGDE